MDRITINNISVFGFHGVLPSERERGQEFQVSLTLEIGLPETIDDCLEDVFDYRLAVDSVRRIMEGRPYLLLETLARRIAGELLTFPKIIGATVRVGKPHPPLPGVQGVFVEISRRRQGGIPSCR